MAGFIIPHLFCVLLLLLLPFSAFTQTSGNINLNSSLSTLDDENSFSASPSGEFAFGFYPLDEDQFLPSIWFPKIPVKTIVWTANKGHPVKRGAKIELTTNGVFLLKDHQGNEIWREPSDGSQAAYASMLDTGNFVLCRDDGVAIWTSFGHPTDTILPTQELDLETKLVSRLSKEEYSTGRFGLSLQKDGDLAMYTMAPFTDNFYAAYWKSNSEGSGSKLVYNQSGYIHLTLSNGSILELNSQKPFSTRGSYHMATLNFDGVFRQYTYPKSIPSNRTWPQSWSIAWSLPSDICTETSLTHASYIGSGACGYNSYCKLQLNQPKCFCPPGYDYVDPINTFKGCEPNFFPQRCRMMAESNETTDDFVMEDIGNVDWSYSEYEVFKTVDEGWCRQRCLDDCFCAAVRFDDGICYPKRFPLSSGIFGHGNGKGFIKKGNININTSIKPDDKKNRDHLILPGSILFGGSVFLNFLLFLVTFMAFSGKKSLKVQQNHINSEMNNNLLSFTYNELEAATNGFKEELGRGAFSTVYKGVLQLGSRSITVAIKQLEKVVKDYNKEFRTEVSAISITNHKNLVELVGFCDEGHHKLLVYEYMRNGSLADFLFANSRPKWSQRTQIALGIARGLSYLHEECKAKIIHCDVKPQNILLDDSFLARLSDFGLAKLLQTDQTRTLTGVRGTRGYLAPEWFRNMPITAKVDVYSFGIVLLNIVSCRKSVELEVEDEGQEILSYWSYDCYREGRLHLLVGNDEEAISDRRRLERFVMIAFWCIQENPSHRPSMKVVTQMLEGTVEVSVPPNPSPSNDSTG